MDDKTPFLIVRDQSNMFVSFDQGRSFKLLDGWSSEGDVAVIGGMFYFGGGGDGNGGYLAFQRDPIKKYRYSEFADGQTNSFVKMFESKGYLDDQINWKHVRAEIGEIDARHFFKCVDGLPWRRSLNYERAHPNDERKEAAKGPAS